jgi:hypothetical protein
LSTTRQNSSDRPLNPTALGLGHKPLHIRHDRWPLLPGNIHVPRMGR